MEPDCLFCKIIKSEIPSLKVYEDESVYAFLDIHPVNLGHTLVVPKRHSRNILETPEDDLAALAATAQKVSRALVEMGAAGVNVMVNNESPAGQVIFHTHWHVVPRQEGDGFTHWRGTARADDTMEAKRAELAAKLS